MVCKINSAASGFVDFAAAIPSLIAPQFMSI